MRSTIFYYIYGQPLTKITGFMILATIVWRYLGNRINRKLWKTLNATLFLLFIFAILNTTIATRSPGTKDLILIPFRSFIEAKEQPELYRSMLMNVFLFFPYGLTLPFAMPEKVQHKIAITICTGAAFSTIIEISQYIFYLGRCETDDVIMNTLGAAIGTLSYFLSGYLKKRKTQS